jgi:transposase
VGDVTASDGLLFWNLLLSQDARRYDREFKENAVTLVQSGRTITEVARDLGVSHWSLNRWVKDAEAGKILSQPRTLAAERLEQRELRRLRQENDYLRRQRDILKKPAASLSIKNPNDQPQPNLQSPVRVFEERSRAEHDTSAHATY